MRELKFRLRTQSTGKLLGYVDIYDLLRNGSDVLQDIEEAILEGVKFEQYTGLKDKNGKEIYEGDRVKYSNGKIETVKFDTMEDSDYDYFYLGWSAGGSLYEWCGLVELVEDEK